MRFVRVAVSLVCIGVMIGGVPVSTPHRAAVRGEECFSATSFCVRGRFLAYWREHGGLARNGYPLSDERQELLEDGRRYTVQYFERVRMEYHPENAPPHDVLLGQFGQRVLRERFAYDRANYEAVIAPAPPIGGRMFFTETGHNLGGEFLAYWRANGGLAQFGFPITDEFEEFLPATPPRTQVQYFERARFEYRPQNAPPNNVQLGLIGRDIFTQANFLTDRFGTLYLTDPSVRELLGVPTQPPTPEAGAMQTFERGWMLYQRGGGNGLIYVLCGEPQAGDVIAPTGYRYFLNQWREAEPVGGGPGPQPGLYEPQRGFGKLWRADAAVQDCLGYATSADETAYMLTQQNFTRGQMLSTPDAGVAFVLATEYGRDRRPVRTRFELVALPAMRAGSGP